MKKLFLLLVIIVFSSFAFAQENGNFSAESIYEDSNKTVYYREQVVFADTGSEQAFNEMQTRIANLESKIGEQPEQKQLSISDYLSFVNLILIIILFFIVLKKQKPPVQYGQ